MSKDQADNLNKNETDMLGRLDELGSKNQAITLLPQPNVDSSSYRPPEGGQGFRGDLLD